MFRSQWKFLRSLENVINWWFLIFLYIWKSIRQQKADWVCIYIPKSRRCYGTCHSSLTIPSDKIITMTVCVCVCRMDQRNIIKRWYFISFTACGSECCVINSFNKILIAMFTYNGNSETDNRDYISMWMSKFKEESHAHSILLPHYDNINHQNSNRYCLSIAISIYCQLSSCSYSMK